MNPLLLKVAERITTRRLVLRFIQPGDARGLNAAIAESFPQLKPWMPWALKKPTLAQTAEYCAEASADFEARREFRMLVLRRNDQALLGGAGLVRGDWLVPKFEIGYWLRTAHTGHGYATEAVKALTGFARQSLKVRRLEIRTDARNRSSANVAKRAGFRLEGKLRQDGRDNYGRLRDTLVFSRIF